MNFKERFQRLLKGLNITEEQLAEIFGVDAHTMAQWCCGMSVPQYEFRATLLRLESENMPALSPHLRADTLEAFKAGRERVVVEES